VDLDSDLVDSNLIGLLDPDPQIPRCRSGNRDQACCVCRKSMLRIRIHMFLGLLDPDPDPFVRGIDPNPSIIKQK
jgi:hypothetical protein